MTRADLLRLRWVNIKTIKDTAPTFAYHIQSHLTQKLVKHAINIDGPRQTNWYRLTPAGENWAYNQSQNWAVRAFKLIPQAELEVGRNDLWNRGWMPAYPSIHSRYVEAAENLGLLKLKDFIRRKKRILYVRLTEKGESFYTEFLKNKNARELKRALSKVYTRKSRIRVNKEFSEHLVRILRFDIQDFINECRREHKFRMQLHALARNQGKKISSLGPTR